MLTPVQATSTQAVNQGGSLVELAARSARAAALSGAVKASASKEDGSPAQKAGLPVLAQALLVESCEAGGAGRRRSFRIDLARVVEKRCHAKQGHGGGGPT
jgi:hypothetical protein